MRNLLGLVVIVASVAVLGGQSKLPPDIHPESLSRLPPVQRDSLTPKASAFGTSSAAAAECRRPDQRRSRCTAPARRNRFTSSISICGRLSPAAASSSSRRCSRRVSSTSSTSGRARAAGPACGARAVRHRRRQVQQRRRRAAGKRRDRDSPRARAFRDHKAGPELWAKTVEFFGRQGAVEIVATMGDYAMAGFMLTAVDQQFPPDRKPLLPPLR